MIMFLQFKFCCQFACRVRMTRSRQPCTLRRRSWFVTVFCLDLNASNYRWKQKWTSSRTLSRSAEHILRYVTRVTQRFWQNMDYWQQIFQDSIDKLVTKVIWKMPRCYSNDHAMARHTITRADNNTIYIVTNSTDNSIILCSFSFPRISNMSLNISHNFKIVLFHLNQSGKQISNCLTEHFFKFLSNWI